MDYFKQECIPVGCVPPAAVAVSPAMYAPCHACPPATHVPFAMHTFLPCMFPSPCMPPFHQTHPSLPHMPPFTMHAPPLPCMPPFTMYPPFTMHAPLCHTCPLTTQAPSLPHMPLSPCMPLLWTEWLTDRCKTLSSANSFAGSNNEWNQPSTVVYDKLMLWLILVEVKLFFKYKHCT